MNFKIIKDPTTPSGKSCLSDCGQYKVKKYAGEVYAYDLQNLSKSLEYNADGSSKEYKTYREAFTAIEKIQTEQKKRLEE